MADEEPPESLEITPTWALATVCFLLILISTLIEHALRLLAEYFNRTRKKSLIQALNNVKSEFMLLGFTSLFLTVSEKPIANICIPKKVGETFLPCRNMSVHADAVEETKCQEQGKYSLLSRQGVRELQFLIFVLALVHSLSCLLTFGLGMAKMKKWEDWEAETRTLEYQFLNDPQRFRLIHQTSFAKRHLKYWSNSRYLRWPACFLRQFCGSVLKVDYLTLRHGFIVAHFEEGSYFDFHKYIKRASDKDFGVVVGISFWMWIFSALFIFFTAHAFYHYLWLPFIPLMMLLLVGTKLQDIITRMCLESNDESVVVRGTLLVKPSDRFFWFGRPKLLLHLLHFILFLNSFQLAFFAWTWYKFGFRSCFHQETHGIVIRFVMGVLVQILCGYVTLPLYALVTQMGTSMGNAVFTEGVVESLKQWRMKARKNMAIRSSISAGPSVETSRGTSPSFSLEASRSVGDVHTSVDIDDDGGKGKVPIGHQRLGSFKGFNLSSASSTS